LNPPVTTCSDSAERQFQFSSRHSGGVQFTLADGSTRFVSETLDKTILQRILTRAGGDVADFWRPLGSSARRQTALSVWRAVILRGGSPHSPTPAS
jgi:prepilin-type processing-associated H-X9-DG protein